MRAIHCDRCNVEIPTLLVGNDIRFRVYPSARSEVSLINTQLDLCAECRDRLIKEIAKVLEVKTGKVLYLKELSEKTDSD